MKQQHTPGPWQVNHMDEIRDAQNNLLASVWDIHVKRSTAGYIELIDNPSKANARLIAAAPELLEFVKELFWYCDSGDSGFLKTYDEAQKLIAKIEGDE